MKCLISISLLVIVVGLIPYRASALEDERVRAAVVQNGRLICLQESGAFRVWNLPDETFDDAAATALFQEGVTQLATSGDTLWAAGNSSLYSWLPKTKAWKKISSVEGESENLEALVIVREVPLLVFPSKVKSPTTGRTFKVPVMEGQVHTDSLRILALHPMDSMLWIGTGHGEWGGNLVGLNPQTGSWLQYSDALHYVTGITHASQDELIVSWSMSHFMADTLIRIHKPDATPKMAYPELQSKYFQRIAYSSYDKMLYGIENTDIVTIKEGEPSKVAALEGQLFEPEPHAIGVAPGIAALIPIAQRTLVIVPNHGLPWKLKDGELTRLPSS